jgi:hypothetical protein
MIPGGMTVPSSPPPIDPNSAWSVPPEGLVPRSQRLPGGFARIVLAGLALLLLAAAAAWAIAVVARLVDFLSADCNLLYCRGHSFNEHVRAYGEALLGAIGAGIAAVGAWRAYRLMQGHDHVSALRRDLIFTVILLAAWSLLLHGS